MTFEQACIELVKVVRRHARPFKVSLSFELLEGDVLIAFDVEGEKRYELSVSIPHLHIDAGTLDVYALMFHGMLQETLDQEHGLS